MKKVILTLVVFLSSIALYSQTKNETLFSYVQNNEVEKAGAL